MSYELFAMSCHSCVICAFEINKWLIIIMGLRKQFARGTQPVCKEYEICQG